MVNLELWLDPRVLNPCCNVSIWPVISKRALISLIDAQCRTWLSSSTPEVRGKHFNCLLLDIVLWNNYRALDLVVSK